MTILVGIILVMISVNIRRSFGHPGSFVNRWTKERTRQAEDEDRDDRNEDIRIHRILLRRVSGAYILLLTSLVFMVSAIWDFPRAWSLAVFFANGLDEFVQKWETKKSDVSAFRRQLRKRLVPVEPEKNEGHSDSSESYDPEQHGNLGLKPAATL